MKNTNYFKASIAGFNYQGYTMKALQAWWDKLKATYNLSGKTLSICQASSIRVTGDVVTASYSSTDVKRLTV